MKRYGGYDGFPFRKHQEGKREFSWELHEDGRWRLWEYWGPGYKIGRVESDGNVAKALFMLEDEGEKECTTEEEGKGWVTMRFVTWVTLTGKNPRKLTLEDLLSRIRSDGASKC